ncbi:hypothetical protein [Thermocatellispora tengchongensis]|uniref:hypothetical protein n=1 Tax=Thermocatellispora tengchongensis TaxID=1073253 RepID=UPI0036454879
MVLIRGHYAHEGRVRLRAFSEQSFAPYHLRVPAGWVPGEDSVARLLDLAREQGYGLVNVLLAETAEGVTAARLERTAAFSRAVIVAGEGEDLDDAVEDVFGVLWVDGGAYDFTPAAEAPPITGRRSAYRARQEAAAEVARLTREAERLREQVTRWRDEAGKWRKSAVEFRRELGAARKELAAAKRPRKRNSAPAARRNSPPPSNVPFPAAPRRNDGRPGAAENEPAREQCEENARPTAARK